jgi:hypothetical protein
MVGFVGLSGRFFSDSQRKAMFSKIGYEQSPMLVYTAQPIGDYKPADNRFAVGATLAAATMPVAATTGTSLAGAGFTGAGMAAVPLGMGLGGIPVVGGQGVSLVGGPSSSMIGRDIGRIEGGLKTLKVHPIRGVGETARGVVGAGVTGAEKATRVAATTAAPAIAGTAGILGRGVIGIGEPYTPTTSELMMMNADGFGLPAIYSRDIPRTKGIGRSIDVEKVRKVVKKQYPEADVDTKVTMLAPEKYMKVALSENPGREDEALKSNGFYSPSDDKTYLELDSNRINTLRALVHEMVHDMSDEGVNDDKLNEGYADYVAFKIMTEEMKIPEITARESLGYPREEKMIESLVGKFGRKEVDRAFLKHHSLDKLGIRSPL